jgi:lysophospholipase L1-like esterase
MRLRPDIMRVMFLIGGLAIGLGLSRFGQIMNKGQVQVPGAHSSVTHNHRSAMFRSLKIRPGSVLMIGDSLTSEGEWSELFENYKVLNRGIAGDRTYNIIDRIDELIRHEPEYIFLMAGINDLIFDQRPPSEMIRDYQTLLSKIKISLPKTNVIVQSLLPVSKSFAASNSSVIESNQRLAELSKLYSATFVDLYPEFIDEHGQLSDAFSEDGLHLNGKGYWLWREILSKRILTSEPPAGVPL